MKKLNSILDKTVNKKSVKTYDFSSIGYAQMILDSRKEKLDKINGVTGIVVIGLLFATGILSKELAIIMVSRAGIGKVTDWLI